MELRLPKNDLLGVVKVAGRAVSTNSIVPSIGNVLFKVTGDKIKVIATNLQIEIMSGLEYDSSEELSILLPPKIIDILDNLPDKEVSLGFSNEKLSIKSGSAKFSLSTFPASDFPLIEESKPESDPAVFSIQDFKNLIKQVVYAVDRDQGATPPTFNGVLFSFRDNELLVTATDRFRLAIKNMDQKSWGFASTQLLVPSGSLNELKKIIDGREGEIKVFPHGDRVVFITDNLYLAGRVYSEKYPDVTKVFPDQSTTQVAVPVNALSAVVSRASIVAEDRKQAMSLKIADGKLTVSASSQIGELTEDVAVEWLKGEDVTVKANISFVLDALSAIGGKAVLELNGGKGPIIIYPEEQVEGERYRSLVLPVV